MRCQSALAVFTLFTSAAFASNKSDIQELKQRIQCLEEKNTCCTETRCTSCSCEPEEMNAFYVSGEALYWKAAESGLASCTKFVSEPPSGSIIDGGRTKHPHFKWHWGFRVEAGYNMCYDLWTVYANWTRYHFKDHKNTNLGPNRNPEALGLPTLFPFWLPDQGILFNSIDTHWRVNLDQVDLQIGREYFLTDYIRLRPHVGMRTAWIHQKYNLDTFSVDTRVSRTDLNMKNNFWGIGIVGGLDSNWGLGCGFSIYGNGSVSILDGHFDSSYNVGIFTFADTFTSNGSLASAFLDKNHQNMAVFIADLALGLRWDKEFSCQRFYLSFWAGYEQHVYFEQNQFLNLQFSQNPVFETNGGNLSTNGITIGLEFGF